jgi:hypothetical protein
MGQSWIDNIEHKTLNEDSIEHKTLNEDNIEHRTLNEDNIEHKTLNEDTQSKNTETKRWTKRIPPKYRGWTQVYEG